MNNDQAQIKNPGYVQIELSKESKQKLHEVVLRVIPKDTLYYSDVVGYIRGDVTSVAHVTVCYGITNPDLSEKFHRGGYNGSINRFTKIIKVGNTVGYKNLYYSIYIVPKLGKQEFELNTWIRSNNNILPSSWDFAPHITLCYVKSSADINDLTKAIEKELVDIQIEFNGIYFYRPETEAKVLLLDSRNSGYDDV